MVAIRPIHTARCPLFWEYIGIALPLYFEVSHSKVDIFSPTNHELKLHVSFGTEVFSHNI